MLALLSLKRNLFFAALVVLVCAFSFVSFDSAMAQEKTTAEKAPATNAGKEADSWSAPINKLEREKIKALRTQVKAKKAELSALFMANPFDEAKAKATFAELSNLEKEIADKRFNLTLEHKKAQPDWKPGEKAKKNTKGTKEASKEVPKAAAKEEVKN